MEDPTLTPEEVQEELSRCNTVCESCHIVRENENE